jgi:hypothetical protein
MKIITLFIILTSSIAVSFTTTSNAKNLHSYVVNNATQAIYRHGPTPTETAFKFGDDPAFESTYAKALYTYQDAYNAYLADNHPKTREFVLEFIRIIARSVPQYYNRMD